MTKATQTMAITVLNRLDETIASFSDATEWRVADGWLIITNPEGIFAFNKDTISYFESVVNEEEDAG